MSNIKKEIKESINYLININRKKECLTGIQNKLTNFFSRINSDFDELFKKKTDTEEINEEINEVIKKKIVEEEIIEEKVIEVIEEETTEEKVIEIVETNIDEELKKEVKHLENSIEDFIIDEEEIEVIVEEIKKEIEIIGNNIDEEFKIIEEEKNENLIIEEESIIKEKITENIIETNKKENYPVEDLSKVEINFYLFKLKSETLHIGKNTNNKKEIMCNVKLNQKMNIIHSFASIESIKDYIKSENINVCKNCLRELNS